MLEQDLALARQADPDGSLSVSDPDLQPFFARGGRLLMYHGWNDPQVPPGNTLRFWEEITKRYGDAVGRSVQLYMIPGMNHCTGGPGTDRFNMMAALEQWAAAGRAPDRIPASHMTDGVVDRTRPLCPYPQVAKYLGLGSTDAAENFSCQLP
jgi:feruloyl esterase